MPLRHARLSLLPLLALGCVLQEWTPMREEAEMIPLTHARRICDAYAEREATPYVPMGRSHPTDRDRIDQTAYSRHFRRCMKQHGWELQPREKVADGEGDEATE